MADWMAKRTLGELPARAAERWPEREALVFGDRRWTWRAFETEVDRVARALIGLGVEPGEKVALWMNNRPEWLFVMFAVARIGAVLVPLNTRYRTSDIRYVLRQSNAGTLISDVRSGPIDYLGMLREVLEVAGGSDSVGGPCAAFPDLRRVVFAGEDTLPGSLSWEDMLAAGAPVNEAAIAARAASVDPDGLVLIAYTSGTTGDPKGVMHSHINIRNCMERAAIMGISFTDIEIGYLPLFHLYGFSEVAVVCALTGAKQILMGGFDAAEALRLIESEAVTIAHGFDTHWKDLLDAQAAAPRDVSSLRLGTLPSGMEAVIPIADRVQEVFCPTISGFGMTEIWAYSATTFPTDTREQRTRASGFPMSDLEFQVGDPETGELVPNGEAGELMVKGYVVMQGYYEKPEATAAAFTADGWFRTGDMARFREDGRFMILGRYKDMLKVGGENVAPAEIEARLMSLAGVRAVSVVGYPDARLNEVAVAFVIPAAGASLGEEQVIEHLRGTIASFKIPRHVVFVDEFPMTPSGKVQKVKLRARAIELLGDPASGSAADSGRR